MGISSALFSSISGLNTMGNAMGVLGDNVSNVNTIAFKSTRATFQDVLTQSIATASGTGQVGRGVTLSTIDGLFAQGSFESTSTATDMAIGGTGFFILRSAESAQGDQYTRAGEFRFDKEGNLVNPAGSFVQGWTIDSTTGQIQGTFGDINIGKSTPPVATDHVDVIVNVDSREINEVTEIRLFDAWNGTNVAAVNPTDPIDSSNYEYTTAIKIFDSKGASHDITIYFDRTTQNNQWEFLVTCQPSEDLRTLSARDQVVYAPNTTYNYVEHKGAGALMYGVLDFNTSGNITNIQTWDVPPDGEVDPAQNTNRNVLTPTDAYFTFPTNFTGAATDQMIELNLGARYSGTPTNQTQIIVSDNGAYSDVGLTSPITKETLWNTVYDAAGNVMVDGDIINYAGYDHDGNIVSGQYTVAGSDKVQDFLTQIGNDFNATATIDANGRLRFTDSSGGDSGLSVTNFTTSSINGSDPFGGGSIVANNLAYTAAGGASTDGGATPITNAAALLTTISDGVNAVAVGDTFTFTGNAVDGTNVTLAGNNVFTVAGASTIQDLLTFIEDLYEDGSSATAGTGAVTATLDSSGRIHIVDNTNAGQFAGISAVFAEAGVPDGVDPFGVANGTNILSPQDSTAGNINVTTSKRQIVSIGRGVTTATGAVPVIASDTDWTNVYDTNGNGPLVSGIDTIRFQGTRGDGTAVDATFSVGVDFGSSLTVAGDNVNDLLTWLEDQFDADASIDGAGRLVLTDRVSDALGGYSSNLTVSSVTYPVNTNGHSLFGAATFAAVQADISGEDGSRMGDVVSTTFESEALASTQYANSSTTIFQDQDGFAAGFLQSVSVDTVGVITGHYSNGQVLKKAQVTLANFNNLAGLSKDGGNIFTETTESGAPITGAPGSNGLGSIAPNSLEQSNVDLGNEFVKLITTQRGFQANSKVITTTDEMLNDLINIKR